jgi:hypothetical protein
MAKTTGFRKVRSGGVDRGDATLNRWGMVPIIQRSDSVSAVGQNRIGVMPDDGGDVLEILTLVDVGVTGSAATMTIDFGTSANTSAFGVIVVSAEGRYTLPVRNVGVPDALTVNVSGSNYFVASAGQHILATLASASGGESTPPTFRCFTTYLQDRTDS